MPRTRTGPGGQVEAGERAPTLAVRDVAEEAGLTARAEDAYVAVFVQDDRLDVRRITAVVCIISWNGE
ncbi:NUDIX domain-containing protein [Streptomyces sp. NPDC001068]|uniref:NUDIX domain-containing protein n=1 Tax=Streptomyces sp. NPDC001068 TaxID=3364544 RepID=UPI00369B5B60